MLYQNKSLDSSNSLSSPGAVLSLAGIAGVLGIVFGVFFAGTMYYQEGHDFGKAFSNALIFIPFILSFLVFHFSGVFKLAILYPITLYLIGDFLRHSDAFDWVRSLFPKAEDPNFDMTTRIITALMIGIVWFIVACLIQGISSLSANKGTQRILLLLIAFAPLALLFCLFLAGPKLKIAHAAKVSAFSQPSLPGVSLVHLEKAMYTVTYRGTSKWDRLFVSTDRTYTFNAQTCGSAQDFPATKPYEVRTLQPEHLTYGYAAFDMNSSTPPEPENAYVDEYYCFVVNGDLYRLQRSGWTSNDQGKLYPAEALIRSIVQSKQTAPPKAQFE